MIEVSFDDIQASHIEQLVANRTLESQYLDFKRQLPDFRVRESVSEMCGDIAAFANASGGYLIYGIAESNGETENTKCASAIVDTGESDEDTLQSRITQIVQEGIEPRGFLVDVKVVTCDNGKRVVVVRVPESFRKPLRARHSGRWMIRTNNINSQLQYHQIQDLFVNFDRRSERVREFREQRISAILSNDSIAPFHCDKLLVYHFIPLPAFDGECSVDLSFYRPGYASPPACLNELDVVERPTVDGFASFGRHHGGLQRLVAKTEVFRNGAIEMVDAVTLYEQDNMIRFSSLESAIRRAIKRAMAEFPRLQINGKVAFFLSLFNVGGMSVAEVRDNRSISDSRASRRNLHLPEYVLDASSADWQVSQATLDLLRNAFGIRRS